jgi:hypothetical protein
VSGWYALVDTAQDPSLIELVQQSKSSECLFSGKIDPVLEAASPHLVELVEGEPLLAAWQQRGAGNNWGIFTESDLPIDRLRRHFKKFLNAKLPDGTIALFRFYDPRVFNTYIRACTPAEYAPWFDGVRQYSVEGESGAIHNYRMRGGRLYDGDAQIG